MGDEVGGGGEVKYNNRYKWRSRLAQWKSYRNSFPPSRSDLDEVEFQMDETRWPQQNVGYIESIFLEWVPLDRYDRLDYVLWNSGQQPWFED